MSAIEKMRQYYVWMCNRGTATYKNGKIDFSHGEGGNNHVHIFDADGNEIGYLWFDTHIGDGMPKRVNEKLGFCGTGTSNCSGIFRDIIEEWFKYRWTTNGDTLFYFSAGEFVCMMDALLDKLR